jgi:hypothetical protein
MMNAARRSAALMMNAAKRAIMGVVACSACGAR